MATDELSGGAALLDAQFGLLMTEIAGIRNEVMLNSTQTTELVERCVRRGQKYNFRSKGNEKQHDFNEGIAACCEEAQGFMKKLERACEGKEKGMVERAAAAAEKGLRMIAHRQKITKIANRSEHGWATVAEYEDDDLAENSEDERRLEKAERAAERKLKRKMRTPYEKVGGRPLSVPAGGRVASANTWGRVVGPCFSCGEMGHLRKACRKFGITVPSPSTGILLSACMGMRM